MPLSPGVPAALPPGTVVDYAGATAPGGWLLCFGQSVLRADYPLLFTAIGVTFGSADGTHFTLPDLRGRVAAGKDDMGGAAASRLTTGGSGVNGAGLGDSGGAETHTLTTAQMPTHTHSPLTGGNTFLTTNNAQQITSGSGLTAATHLDATTGSAGSGAAHQNTQPTLVMNKIIYVGV